jgi:DHA1 family bicyclomycin/chloramphenicol resistance-like MFS transporter
MSRASLRTVLPLALATGASMLATDLYLPAVPVLQTSLGVDVSAAQATVAIFFAGLAFSQLAWGESLNRLGPRRCIAIGIGVLTLTSVACALASSLPWLLAFRFIQGLGAGAATIVAPSVVRATLDGPDAVRGIAAISMVEALVPAAGPVFGALLLTYISWRGTFWILAAAALIVLPIVVRITPRELPGLDHSVPAGYGRVLANRRFLRIILSHALMGGALFMFVSSGPQLLKNVYGLDARAFALLQVVGVAGFIITASRSSRIAAKIGNARAVKLGAAAHIAICAALALLAFTGYASYPVLLVFWCSFCCFLAVRGPTAISDALDLPAAQMGRASAIMILALLSAAALGTQLIAPLLDGPSVLPMAVGMLIFTVGSMALITPYPAAAGSRLRAEG